MREKRRSKALVNIVVSTALLVSLANAATAQVTFDVLTDFVGTTSTQPWGGVIKGMDGAFYGTTQVSDTPPGCGTVYRLASDGGLTVLHEFVGTDGCNPVGELVEGPDGSLYGTTVQGGPYGGGSTATQGTGTVFRITPSDGVLTTLHAFAPYNEVESRYPEGIWPFSGLTQGTDGNFYGLTNYGGQGATGPAGTFFRITPSGVFTLLHSFEGAEAAHTNSGLTLGSDGNFVGTAALGGGNDNGGSVFKVTPAGVVTRLFAFSFDDGCACFPYGYQPIGEPVEDGEGNLYGTTSQGGPGAVETRVGTAWKLSPSGEMTLVYAFTGGSNGALPTAGLTVGTGGHLYGTTYGSSGFGDSTVFRITGAGSLTTLYSFDQAIGPDGRLLEVSPGVFVGTTQSGGTGGKGLVYRLALASATTTSLTAQPNASVYGQQVTITATVSSDGGSPTGQVQFFNGTTLLMTTALNNRVAEITTTALGVGAHSLSAVYLGDVSFLRSTSPPAPVTVARAQTTMSLSSSPNPSSRKQPVIVAATVTAVSPGAGTPTGQVQLFDGKKRVAMATLLNGTASFPVSFNSMGQRALRVVYAGDNNFSPTEGTHSHTVAR